MIFERKFSGASALHTWRTKLKIFINNLVSFLRTDAQNTKKLKKSYTLGALILTEMRKFRKHRA